MKLGQAKFPQCGWREQPARKKSEQMKATKVDYRSAKTGRFVKENYANTHKSTTVKETRRK